MTNFESSTKTILADRKQVFEFLSDISNFATLVPEGKVRDFESGRDYARFHVDGLGEVGIRIVSENPFDTITFGSEGSVPFKFSLQVNLSGTDPGLTVMNLSMEADLNVMMKMMARKPLEEGIEMVASRLTDHLNSRQWA
jgi:carbon monoxide dehydrogenase subunit G